MRFEFATAGRILFGPGSRAELPALAAELGRRALLVTDSPERSAWLVEGLHTQGLSVELFLINHEPDIATILRLTQAVKTLARDLLIGLGGGSAIDSAKAAAALAANPHDPLHYLEVVGAGQPLVEPSLPCIAVPTTAGTGAEVTRNAVIAVPEQRVKVSLRSPYLLPRLALVDPELTLSLPPALTASTGMDALTQVLEPFVCNAPSPLTDALCRDALSRVGHALPQAYAHGSALAARQDMALVSLYGGLALANARLGAVHGLAAPLGGMYSAPHGAVCARLLPLVMQANLNALRTRQPDAPALARYAEAARLLTGNPQARLEDGIDFIQRLCQEMEIRPLGEFGLRREDLPLLVAQAGKASSMKGNPIQLTADELGWILSQAC